VAVLPTANPDQLGLFQRGQINAAWTVEPWVSRLILEAGGQIYLEQTDTVTTILVTSVKFLKNHPDLAAKFRAAHSELTTWIQTHTPQAQDLVQAGLSAETRHPFPATLVRAGWKRLHFTDQLAKGQFDLLIADAQSVGFLRNAIAVDRLFSGQP